MAGSSSGQWLSLALADVDGIEIRAPREDEFHSVAAVDALAFGEELTAEDEAAYRIGFPFGRALCAFDDGKMVSSSAVLTMELTVPGKVALAAGGVTWVATLPTYRRRGLLRRLMTAQFEAMIDHGDVFSVLLASEATIYGRFGYGPATSVMRFSIERPYAVFGCPADGIGRLSILDADQAAIQLPAIFDRLRLLQPGQASRPADWWPHYLRDPALERDGATPMVHVVHETVPGMPDGYVSYRIKDRWIDGTPASEVRVVELLAADPTAYKELWHYIFNTDLAQTIRGRGRTDEPLRWMLSDPRRFEVRSLVDDLYLRLLDVPRALCARAYSTSGEMVFEVRDEFPVERIDRYLLVAEEAGRPGAECTRTSRTPDLSLDVTDLAAAYLGGVSFATLAAAGRVQASSNQALERADAMFATAIAPFCFTEF